MDGRICRLKKRILENLQHDWTIANLAAEIGLSAPHLQRLFKSQTGISPVAFIRDLRLERARELLESEGEYPHINEIGRQVGIFNDSHFTRDFKKKFGLAPREYRKHHWRKIYSAEPNGKK
jgi:AraC-like DNA-binding protein